MPRAARTCSTCPAIVDAGTRQCAECARKADRARGTSTERGYNTRGHQRFRAAVLARDPICAMPDCWKWATVADHYPRSRRELLDAGDNPNDPTQGRGLCASCHGKATASNPDQAGGWNRR